MKNARAQGAATLIVVALISGCAHVPIEELESYRTAFHQVSTVSGALYEEAAKVIVDVEAAQLALKRGGRDVGAGSVNPPSSFDPGKVDGSGGWTRDLPEPIALRLSAMQTVVAYNDALVAHASGDPLEKVVAPLKVAAGQIEGLAALASSIPAMKTLGLGPVTGLGSLAVKLNPFGSLASGAIEGLKGFARLALQAKAENEVREALLAGYAPVQQVLAILEADSEQVYGFQKVRCALTRYEAINMTGKTLGSIAGLSEAFARPMQAPLATTVGALEQRMTASVIAIYQPSTEFDPCGSGEAGMTSPEKLDLSIGFPYKFPFAQQLGKSMTDNAAQALDVFVTDYEKHAARTVAARESLQNYHSRVLPDYVILLRNAKRGLETVRVSASRQPAPAERAVDLIKIGANIRSNIDSIRSAKKADATTTFP